MVVTERKIGPSQERYFTAYRIWSRNKSIHATDLMKEIGSRCGISPHISTVYVWLSGFRKGNIPEGIGNFKCRQRREKRTRNTRTLNRHRDQEKKFAVEAWRKTPNVSDAVMRLAIKNKLGIDVPKGTISSWHASFRQGKMVVPIETVSKVEVSAVWEEPVITPEQIVDAMIAKVRKTEDMNQLLMDSVDQLKEKVRSLEEDKENLAESNRKLAAELDAIITAPTPRIEETKGVGDVSELVEVVARMVRRISRIASGY